MASEFNLPQNVKPFAIKGIVVDSLHDWSLRIEENCLLAIDNRGTIAYRGLATQENVLAVKEKFGLDEVIELDNSEFLLPGLIDSHIHASQYPNAGLGLELPLLEWLQKYTFPMERSIGEDLQFAHKVYRAAVDATLSSGTTAAAYFATIHGDASLVLADMAEELGQRALVGKVNIDRNGFERYEETTSASLSSTSAFVHELLNRKSSLVAPVVTPRFVPTCSNELLVGLGDIAGQTKARIHTHLSECRPEVAWVAELHPECPHYTDVYKCAGLLKSNTILAHGIYLSDQELLAIRDSGAGISHCPNSNCSIRSGSMDLMRYKGFGGLKLGLGTDCSGGYSPSMIDSMRFAIATSNQICIDKQITEAANFKDAIYLATRGSAQVCSLDKYVGGFDVGLQFDALRIQLNPIVNKVTQLFGHENIVDMVHKFVFVGDDRNIVQVFVNGKCVKNLL